MFEFTDAERTHLREMRAMSTDAQGREVLVGLTVDESEEFMLHARDFLLGERHREDRERYLELADRHERARLEVLGTEHFLRSEKPSIQ